LTTAFGPLRRRAAAVAELRSLLKEFNGLAEAPALIEIAPHVSALL
jgi:hypothetical protein